MWTWLSLSLSIIQAHFLYIFPLLFRICSALKLVLEGGTWWTCWWWDAVVLFRGALVKNKQRIVISENSFTSTVQHRAIVLRLSSFDRAHIHQELLDQRKLQYVAIQSPLYCLCLGNITLPLQTHEDFHPYSQKWYWLQKLFLSSQASNAVEAWL